MHMCCAPCAVYPLAVMQKKGINVEGLYYNPNIHPYEEFMKREESVKKLASLKKIKVHYMPDFKQDIWDKMSNKETNRCTVCYEMRLKKAFAFAKENNYDAVTTSLLVSPYQNHELIIKNAQKYAKQYKIQFHYEDFRVGYRQGQKEAKDLGVYCQRYCGCILSLKARIKEIVQQVV